MPQTKESIPKRNIIKLAFIRLLWVLEITRVYQRIFKQLAQYHNNIMKQFMFKIGVFFEIFVATFRCILWYFGRTEDHSKCIMTLQKQYQKYSSYTYISIYHIKICDLVSSWFRIIQKSSFSSCLKVYVFLSIVDKKILNYNLSRSLSYVYKRYWSFKNITNNFSSVEIGKVFLWVLDA